MMAQPSRLGDAAWADWPTQRAAARPTAESRGLGFFMWGPVDARRTACARRILGSRDDCAVKPDHAPARRSRGTQKRTGPAGPVVLMVGRLYLTVSTHLASVSASAGLT